MIGHSPDIDMHLDCGGIIIPLRQTAPAFIIPFEARDLPACDAVIAVFVDGKRFERPVRVARMRVGDERVTVGNL